MGFYIAPDNAFTIRALVVVISHSKHGAEMLVVGNFNEDLAVPEGNTCDKDINASLDASGLEDITNHFLLLCKPWLKYRQAWSMICGGRRCAPILTTSFGRTTV